MPGPGAELIGDEEIAEALEVLRSGRLFRYGSEDDVGFGAKVYEFERRIAEHTQVPFALGVNSGTSALLVAILGLGIGPGDEVIVPGYTFVATMSSVVFARAVPVLAEVDETFNLDPSDVEAKITSRTKAILAVHMLGNPARMDELEEIARRHDLLLIEDAAQAFGATYHGRPVGGLADAGIFSFNFYKTITAGDGGMVVTRDEDKYERFFAIHDQGHTPLRRGLQVGSRPFLGLDFRMTELTAAILHAQLRRLPLIRERLHKNRDLFRSCIADVDGLRFRTLTDEPGELATFLTVILPDPVLARSIADDLHTTVVADSGWHVYSNMEHLLERRTVSPAGCPFNCDCYPTNVQYHKGMLPNTDSLLARSINIGIGVVDRGIGAGFGVSVQDDQETVLSRAQRFREVALRYL